eukprot:2110037-Rhodomonas_salina.1
MAALPPYWAGKSGSGGGRDEGLGEREGGRGREGERESGREGERERGREGERGRWREGERERGRERGRDLRGHSRRGHLRRRGAQPSTSVSVTERNGNTS